MASTFILPLCALSSTPVNHRSFACAVVPPRFNSHPYFTLGFSELLFFFSCCDKTPDRNGIWEGTFVWPPDFNGYSISPCGRPRSWAGSDCRNLWHGLFTSWRIEKQSRVRLQPGPTHSEKCLPISDSPLLARPFLPLKTFRTSLNSATHRRPKCSNASKGHFRARL